MMKLSRFSVLLFVALLLGANVALARPSGFTGAHSGFSGGHGATSHGRGDFHGGGDGFHGGNWHGHGHGYWHGFYGGVYVDPWIYPWGYYPWGVSVTYPGAYVYGADPEVVVMPPPPQTYIEAAPEQQYAPAEAPAPSQPQSSDWYYCSNPDGYYPYVKSCSTDWQRVPSHPAN